MKFRKLWKRAVASKLLWQSSASGEQAASCRSTSGASARSVEPVGEPFTTEQETTRRPGILRTDKNKPHSRSFFII